MPRSILSRSLEPLAAIAWGLFIAASIWMAAVWILPLNADALGLLSTEENGPPTHIELRRAVLIFATHADLIWLGLAVVNLHLIISAGNGLGTARVWFGFTAGSALLLGVLNNQTSLPFGGMHFGSGLGRQIGGVALGWVLLWAALLMAAREGILCVLPRASHATVAFFCAILVLATVVNAEPVVRHARVWWDWFGASPRDPTGPHWQAALAGFAWPWLITYSLREKDIVAAAKPRSVKPLIILAILNSTALVARLRMG